MAVNKLREMLSFLKQVGQINGQDMEVSERLLNACLVDLETGGAIQFHEATDMLQLVQAAEIEGWMGKRCKNWYKPKWFPVVSRTKQNMLGQCSNGTPLGLQLPACDRVGCVEKL